MEYSLQGYFDIGVSYGLGDKVFKNTSEATVPNILEIGISNPLGLGLLHRLDPDDPIIQTWRENAALMLNKKEMELGYDTSITGSPSEEAFKAELHQLIREHPIALCHLTIYAIGVVFIRMDFANGLPTHFLQGFSHCFEYAAYLEPVSSALLNAARSAAKAALRPSTRKRGLWKWWRSSGLGVDIQSLSKRPEPETPKDEQEYTESRLFTGFTHVAMCTDENDDVQAIKRVVMPLSPITKEPESESLYFEYHGWLHFNWSGCVLQPRSFDDPDESPWQQMQRMLFCIQIAHSFHAACDAFERLFFHETLRQADAYIKGVPGDREHRSHVELNRLRTLALAVVALTRFDPVAVAEEDRAYFEAYEKRAKLRGLHDIILQRSDILLNVQSAEAQEEQTGRELFLNTVLLFLTGFTLLSVLADTYNFASENSALAVDVVRTEILAVVISAIFIVLLMARRKVVGRRKRGP